MITRSMTKKTKLYDSESIICSLMGIDGVKIDIIDFLKLPDVLALMLTCKNMMKDVSKVISNQTFYCPQGLMLMKLMATICTSHNVKMPKMILVVPSDEVKDFMLAPRYIHNSICNMQLQSSSSSSSSSSSIPPLFLPNIHALSMQSGDDIPMIIAPKLQRALIQTNYEIDLNYLRAEKMNHLHLEAPVLSEELLATIHQLYPALETLSLTSNQMVDLNFIGETLNLKRLSIQTEDYMCNQYIWEPLTTQRFKHLRTLVIKGSMCLSCIHNMTIEPAWTSKIKYLSIENRSIPVDWFHTFTHVEHLEVCISTSGILEFIHLFPAVKTLNIMCETAVQMQHADKLLKCKNLHTVMTTDFCYPKGSKIIVKPCWSSN
jgi:hypothetical protein